MSRNLRRLTAAAGSVVLMSAFAAATETGASAAPSRPSGADRFHRVTPQQVSSDHVVGLNNRPVTVIVQLTGDPVVVADKKAGNSLTKAEKSAIRSALKSQQAGVASHVRALGGKVGATYQASYNGLRVTIAQRNLAKVRSLPDVVAVRAITPKTVDNVHGVPLVGAPAVWDGLSGVNGLHGENIKIAIIDTGVDYTHADFGGPGTPAAYDAEHAAETADPNPTLVGPAAPRVKGGFDFVGDTYNADPDSDDYQPVPHPDNNPLDCNGHGSHVAGTAAGSGVLADGSTYSGPYNADTISSHSWKVGPGVAPKADIYALRVFGCSGSTDVVVDAIEWAVNHSINVINMSLGSPFGGANDPDAVASNNAAAHGTIVVTSAGNEGPNPYLVGSPSTGNGTISVAANDPTPSFPAANVALSTGPTLQAINANGVPVNGLSAPVKVLYTGTPHDVAHISLGCDPAEYVAAGVTGAIVVVKRGTCARVARAIFGEQAGAAAVIMVNNANSLPPFEGPITSNPDNGTPFDVTIPFLGVKSSDAAALVAADNAAGTATLTDTTLVNPGYLATASFSSGGPRSGDSALKPDVTAPGVSIQSVGIGTGNGPAIISGTSMASPHTAGVAALIRQAHPTWGAVAFWKAAIVNTADPSLVSNYATRVNGAGFVQAQRAAQTDAIAIGVSGTATLSYGFSELTTAAGFSQSRTITVHNFSKTAMTFDVGHTRDSGSPHSLSFSASSITVPARNVKAVTVTLAVPGTTAGNSSAFRDVAGLVTFTPQSEANHGIALSVPFYLVPLAVSKVTTSLATYKLKSGTHSTTAQVKNLNGVVAGTADWYAWGISDPRETGLTSNDIRAVGAQSFPDDGVFAFGLNTWNRWSNAAANEYDIYVDVNGDDEPDYVVVAADFGLVTAGDNDGRTGVFVFNLASGDGGVEFLADAPFNGTTMALPVLFDQLCDEGSPCLSAESPRITYFAVGFAGGVPTDEPSAEASFNVFSPAVSTGMFDEVAPNATVNETVTLDPVEFAITRPLGFMIMSHDNQATAETLLLKIP